MKKITKKLQEHLNGEVLTLATCWQLKLKDETTLGFTDSDNDITIDNITYRADTGFTPSAVANSSTLTVDNLDIEGVIDSNIISERDILAGRYDHAEIEIFVVNYTSPGDGKLHLRRGWLGEVNLNKNQFSVEVRGLIQSLSHTIGELYSPSCRATLGDNRCQISLSEHTFQGEISEVINKSSFLDELREENNGYFDCGLITFETGANKGISMEIKYYRDNKIELVMPMPYDLNTSDKFTIIAGCNKQFGTCINKFDNAINFRGEPHVPSKTSF